VLTVQGIASMTPLKVDGSGVTQPVSGTVTANAGSGNFTVVQTTGTNLHAVLDSGSTTAVTQATASNLNAQVVGSVASAGSNTGNPVKIGGAYNSTQPTVTTGQIVDMQMTTRGAQIVATGVDAFAVNASQSGTWNVTNVSGTISLPTGAATSAKQPALGTAGTASSDVLTVQGIASMTALKVDGSSVTQPVSGTVTVQQSTASNLKVDLSGTSANSIAIKVDGSAVTQPVSGTITANAGSGTFNNQQTNITTDYDTGAGTQTMTMFGLALPASGGAVSGGTSSNPLRTDPTGVTTQPISGTVTANQGGTWNITNVSGTVSLPTGAATSAKQPALGTAGSASTDVLTVQGIASMTALKVDGSGVTQPVSGTVTANIGTTNGLALDTSVNGILLSQGSTTSGQKGSLVQGAVTTNVPTYTTTQTSPLSLDTSGLLRVSLKDTPSNTNNLNVALAASSATVTVAASGNFNNASVGATGSAVPASASYIAANKSGNLVGLSLDTSGNLNVNVAAGSSGNAAAAATGSAVPASADYTGVNVAGTLRGQTGVNPSGSIYAGQTDLASVAGTTTDTNSGNKSAGTIRVVLATDQPQLTNALKVDGSGVTQPVSGTVTANIGTTNGLALDTSVNGILLSQGATTSGEKGPLIQGAVTTGAPTYTTAQTSPISLTTAGAVRVDASATTQPVSGTVTANAGTGTFNIQSNASVNVAQVSGSSVATAATGIMKVGLTDGTGTAITSTSNAIDVNIKSGGGSGFSVTDESAWTAGTSAFVPTGGVFNDTAAALTTGQEGSVRLTNNRAIHVNLRDASANQLLGSKTSADSIPVVIASDQAAVPASQSGTWNITNVSGTVSLPTGAATSAKQPALGTAGSASVDVITVQGIASMTALKVDGSAVTQPVSGTVTANAGTGTFNIQSNASVNITQIAGSSVSTATTGVQKVGIVGNGGASVDGTIGAGTAPTNAIVTGSIYNTSAPAPTNGQAMALQADQAGNIRTFPGIALTTLSAWNSGTSLNATQNIFTNSGAASALVQLTQTTTLSAGAVTFEVTYDNSNWSTIPADCVLDPTSTTFAQISVPYTVQASTNKAFLLSMNGAQGLRVKLSTQITGSGSVTPNYALLAYNPAASMIALSPTAANFNVSAVQSGTWNISNVSGTVSLPTGAATSAKQPALGTAGSASSDVITVQGITSMTALKVDGSSVTQPVSGTVSITANSAVNVAQVAGTTTDTNSGNKSAGTQRVVLATDQPQLTNALKVDGSGVTQPVSGTVTANIGTSGSLALDASVNGILLSQGSTTSGQKGPLIQGAVTTNAPSYTTAQTSPLSMDPSGLLRVSLKDTPSNTNNLNVNLAASAATVTVSGTVTANQGGSNWSTNVAQIGGANIVTGGASGLIAVGGPVASGASNADNPLKVGGVFNTTQPTITNGQIVDAQYTARGAAIVATGTDTFSVTANAGTNLNTSLLALESGGNLATLAGAVTSAKVQANVAQINGVAPTMGNGVSGTGVQRVTIASDSTGQVTLASGANTIGAVTQASGPWTSNVTQISGSSISTAATGVQKVGVVGNTGATIDSTIGAGTAPTNAVVTGAIYNSSAPAPTTGQAMALQADQAGNARTFPGIALATLSAWNSGTSLNATQNIFTNSGAAAVLVQLTQTTTLSAGATIFEVSYDGSTWQTIPASCVLDPTSTTFAQISLPYTVQASTNKMFLLNSNGAQGLRIKLSTQITGSGSVTPNYALLPASPANTVVALSPTAANFNTSSVIQAAAGTALTADQSNTILKTSLYVKKSANADTVLALGSATSANSVPVVVASDQGAIPASQSGTWTVQPGNTANSTAWLVQPVVGTSGGATASHTITASGTNGTNLKNSAGQVYNLQVSNGASTACYFRFYNSSSSPTVGTTTVYKTIQVPGNGTVISAWPDGLAFSTGISWSVTGSIADNDTTSVSTNVSVDIDYK
jgi:hypothetical protein